MISMYIINIERIVIAENAHQENETEKQLFILLICHC